MRECRDCRCCQKPCPQPGSKEHREGCEALHDALERRCPPIQQSCGFIRRCLRAPCKLFLERRARTRRPAVLGMQCQTRRRAGASGKCTYSARKEYPGLAGPRERENRHGGSRSSRRVRNGSVPQSVRRSRASQRPEARRRPFRNDGGRERRLGSSPLGGHARVCVFSMVMPL